MNEMGLTHMLTRHLCRAVSYFPRRQDLAYHNDLPERHSDFSAAPALLGQLSPILGIAENRKIRSSLSETGRLMSD